MYTAGIKRPTIKVSKSTRVCSAHFAPGYTVPYVKSPILIKPKQPSRRILVHKSVKDRSEYYPAIPNLSQLCSESVKTNLAKSIQYECSKEELKQQVSTSNSLRVNLFQTSPQIVTLQDEKSHLQCQQRVCDNKITFLEAGLARLSLQNELLQKKVCTLQSRRYRLNAEHLKDKDKHVQCYTGVASWKLFMLLFQSLQVYDLQNLQYVGRERTFPPGDKRVHHALLTP